MKKTIAILCIGLLSGMASALTLQWAGASVAYGGNTLKSSTAVTGYLVYLEKGSLETSYTVGESFSAASVGTVVDSKNKTSAVGKLTGTWTIDTSTYGNGDSFAMLLVYDDATSGKQYFNLSSSVNAMSGVSIEPPVNADNQAFEFSYSAGTDGTLTAGGGWVAAAAVPEPATGALALAGIALLLKRRKAAKA